MGSARRAWLLAIVCVLLAPAAAHGATFGANVGGLFTPGKQIDGQTITILQALRATGATNARTDTWWQLTEPNAPVNGGHTYDWSFDDSVATALAAAGLRWFPIIDYATPWSADPGAGAGTEPGVATPFFPDFVSYATAFVARYGPGGAFWAENPQLTPFPVDTVEIWNEPDVAMYWAPHPDIPDYATLFLQTRAAIKAEMPSAKVVIGGLVFPRQTLPTMYQTDPALYGNADGVAVHPYRSSADEIMQSIAYDLQTDAATVGAPLYVNEFGWGYPNPNHPDQTEANRDANTEQATQLLGGDPYVADVEPYCWGCGTIFDMYGTTAASAFAAGIAAVQRAAAGPTGGTGGTGLAPPSSGGTGFLGATHRFLTSSAPTHHRRHHRRRRHHHKHHRRHRKHRTTHHA